MLPFAIPLFGQTAGVVTFISSSAVGVGDNNTLVLSVPAAVQNGDILVAVMVGSFSGGSAWSQASWVKRFERSGNGGPAIFTRIASSEPSFYTFSQTNNNNYSGAMLAFRNGAFNVVGASAIDTNPLVAPSVTVSSSGSILIGFFAANSSNRTPSTPAGMTQRVMDNDGTNPSFAVFTQDVGQGATGTRSSTVGTLSNVTGVLLALGPQ